MDTIQIGIIIGLVMIAVLVILICVLLYKLRRVQKHKEVKKPTEVKIEGTEVKTEKGKKRKKLFSGILTKRRKSIEAKQYGIWK